MSPATPRACSAPCGTARKSRPNWWAPTRSRTFRSSSSNRSSRSSSSPPSFGDSSKIQVGEYVLAMGSPMALSQSVTLGIISNTEMTMPRFWGSARRFRLDGEDVGSLVRWIGHDAAIYGGNSGGPLVNLRGKIIGINEISYGLGGAIPGNLAQSVAERDHGQRPGPAELARPRCAAALQALPGQARGADQRRDREFPGGQGGLQTRRPAAAPGQHRHRCPLRGANAGLHVALGRPAHWPARSRRSSSATERNSRCTRSRSSARRSIPGNRKSKRGG